MTSNVFLSTYDLFYRDVTRIFSLNILLTSLKRFSFPSSVRHQQPPSPFKRPLGLGHLANANNGSLSENSSCTSSSSGSGLAAVGSSLQVDHNDHGFHSGMLPTIADVRSPGVNPIKLFSFVTDNNWPCTI